MRKNDTNGEYAISNVEVRVGSRTHELPMDSDAFGGFYQRSAPALPTSCGSRETPAWLTT